MGHISKDIDGITKVRKTLIKTVQFLYNLIILPHALHCVLMCRDAQETRLLHSMILQNTAVVKLIPVFSLRTKCESAMLNLHAYVYTCSYC